jgi:single-stranded DNA-specific DHH superfamily exonuclease
MSINWAEDMNRMHKRYGVHEAISKLDKKELRAYLNFRIRFLQEELDELKEATKPMIPIDAEETVDALIDLCVVAIGTLDAFGVNAYEAWNQVLAANLNKEVGIKESRPNPYGLPDLVKPEGWTPPDHSGNYGKIGNL